MCVCVCFYLYIYVLIVVHEHVLAHVTLTGQYTQLGGLLRHQGITKQKVRRRFGIAHAAFTQHREILFQNNALPASRRRDLFSALVLSKLYGLETWVFSDLQTEKYAHAALLRLYRRLLKIPPDRHLSDAQLLALCEMPDLSTLMRQARLRYLATLYAVEDLVDWRLLLRDQQWIRLVHEDLHWLGDCVPSLASLRGLCASPFCAARIVILGAGMAQHHLPTPFSPWLFCY